MAKKRKKGVIRRLKVVMTNGEDKILNVLTNANPDKSDAELVEFVQNFNALSSNSVEKITRIDWEDITDAEPGFEKVEGIAVYNSDGKLINGKMTITTDDDIQAMLDGADAVYSNESDTSTYTIAVYSNGKLTDTSITFATTADVDAMLNDDSPADFDNTDGYTLAMITSDGKLADSGVGFATADDVNAFLRSDLND